MKPTIATVVLSAAAVLGYLTYRLTLAPSTPEPATAETQTAAARQLPDTLPQFSLADLEGTQTPLSTYAGEPMIINFWATWCAPCLREIPRLKEYQSAHEDVTVLGIAVDSLEAVTGFAADMQFNYPVLAGQADAMNAAAGFGVDVLALPFTVFTSADGAVIGVHTGEVHTEHLENYTAVLADLEAGEIALDTARSRMAGMM